MTRTDYLDGGDPADRLDDELDRMVRGERPETGAKTSEFAPTIDRLVALASAARIGADRPSAPASQSPLPVHERRLTRTFPDRIRRFPMSVTSTAAIVAIVIAITFGTFQSLGTDPSGPSSSTSFVQNDATPMATPDVNLLVVPPRALSREDCNVEPRTREDLIQILGTVPESVPERLGPQISLDQRTFDVLQQAVYAYQACLQAGQTYQWTALESSNALRHRIYQPGQVTPYTPSTLSEILDGWEEIDSARAQTAEFAGAEPVWVLDPYKESEAGVVVTESFIQVPVSEKFFNGSEVNHGNLELIVQFTLEEGVWRMESFPSVPQG